MKSKILLLKITNSDIFPRDSEIRFVYRSRPSLIHARYPNPNFQENRRGL